MFAGLETGFGLDVVIWIQAFANPTLDFIAQGVHVIGAPVTYLLVIVPVIAVNRRALRANLAMSEEGQAPSRIYQWIFTLIVAVLITDVLKLVFHAPRPYQVAPELVRLLVHQRSSYGLPSGHVSAALAMIGLAAAWGRRSWLWLIAIGWTLLVAWSRMYAGVHYPQDVIAGELVGVLALWITLRYFKLFIQWWNGIPLAARVVIAVIGVILVVNVPGI